MHSYLRISEVPNIIGEKNLNTFFRILLLCSVPEWTEASMILIVYPDTLATATISASYYSLTLSLLPYVKKLVGKSPQHHRSDRSCDPQVDEKRSQVASNHC